MLNRPPLHSLAVLLSLAAAAPAKDVFLTIGGGYDRTGNQVSLERNIEFQREVLHRVRPGTPTPETYFSSGDAGTPDVQYADPHFQTHGPKARRLMAQLFGNPRQVTLRYRPHRLDDVAGPADRNVIRRRMRKLTGELQSGDRLILYFTGHGGAAQQPEGYKVFDAEGDLLNTRGDGPRKPDPSEYNTHNTTIYLWERAKITASDFAGLLDGLPADVTVVMVMVQCFSGGYAHTIFHQADEQLGLAPFTRCGFFSQRHDRYAAGCTPDIDKADYQEYSSFFWAALGGRTRSGELIGEGGPNGPGLGADYNGDGVVSLAEAHSYAVVTSDTIDVPIRTTGALLRKYSSLGPRGADDEKSQRAGGRKASPLGKMLGLISSGKQGGSDNKADNKANANDEAGPETEAAGDATPDPSNIRRLEGPLSELARLGRPDQAAILDALADRLSLGPDATIDDLKKKLADLNRAKAKASRVRRLAGRAVGRSRKQVADGLAEKWPELRTAYSPVAAALSSERADEFVAAVEAAPAFQAYQRARAWLEKATNKQRAAEHRKVKAERLLRTCENIVLAHNLPLVAPREVVKQFRELLAAEEATLGPTPSPQPARAASRQDARPNPRASQQAETRSAAPDQSASAVAGSSRSAG